MNTLKNIIETQINNSKRLELLFNENEKEKRRIEKEISISRHEMNRLKTSLETQVKNSEHLEVLFNENEKEKRSIEKEISTSRLEINRLQNIIENQKNYSKQLEFLFNKEVKILIKKSDSSKLIKKKHTRKENLNWKLDNKMIINMMSPVILLKMFNKNNKKKKKIQQFISLFVKLLYVFNVVLLPMQKNKSKMPM